MMFGLVIIKYATMALFIFICYKQVKLGGPVQNKGWVLEQVDHKDASVPEEVRIRGFRINKVEQLELNYTEPGKFCFKS